MPEKITIKVFIGSSGELKEEREKCILILNKINKNYKHLDLEPVEWEYDVVQGNFPNYENIQAGINPKLSACAVAVFLFHSKIGRHTRTEFELAEKENKKLFVYFKDGYTPNKNTLPAFSELLDFKESLNEKILYKEYKSIPEFELVITDNLNLFLSQNYQLQTISANHEITPLSQIAVDLIKLLVEKEKEIKKLKNDVSHSRQIAKAESQLGKLIREKESIQEELLQNEEIKNTLVKEKKQLESQLLRHKEKDVLRKKALNEVENGNFVKAENYLKQSAKDSISETASTFYELAKIKTLQLQYTEAFNYYELAIKIDPDNIQYQNEAGLAAYSLELFDEAARHFKNALDLATEQYKENNIDIAIFCDNLGLAYYCLAKYDKAIAVFKKAIDIYLKKNDKTSLNLSHSYNNIGLAYNQKGEYDKAIKFYENSLKINVIHFGENSKEIAIEYNNLGTAFFNIAKYDEAINFHIKALEINLKFYKEDSPELTTDYNNLGSAYNSIGDYDKAIMYHKKALEIDLRHHGKKHSKIAIRYNNLGLDYNSKGEYHKAIEYYKKALEIDLEYYNGEHPDVAVDYNNLGVAYYNTDMYAKAIECYEKSLFIFEKFLPANHTNVQNAYKNIQLAKEAR